VRVGRPISVNLSEKPYPLCFPGSAWEAEGRLCLQTLQRLLLEAEPPKGHSQAEPGNEIQRGFYVKLTPMGKTPPLRVGTIYFLVFSKAIRVLTVD